MLQVFAQMPPWQCSVFDLSSVCCAHSHNPWVSPWCPVVVCALSSHLYSLHPPSPLPLVCLVPAVDPVARILLVTSKHEKVNLKNEFSLVQIIVSVYTRGLSLTCGFSPQELCSGCVAKARSQDLFPSLPGRWQKSSFFFFAITTSLSWH